MAKRPHSSLEEEERVCVVSFSDGTYLINIFDLNLNDNNNNNVAASSSSSFPALCFIGSYHISMAFALHNSTLFFFGGQGGDDFGWQRDVYSYDVITRETAQRVSDNYYTFNLLKPLEFMKFKKNYPHAVSIGDEICVFSCTLDPGTKNFEVYEPRANSWRTLPEPCDPVEGGEVKFYCVENGVLFICTLASSYCIDFSRPKSDQSWEPCFLPPCYNQMSNDPHPVLRDRTLFVLPTFFAYDATDEEPLYFGRPPCQWTDDDFYPRDQYIIRLPSKGYERLRACIVETAGIDYVYDWDEGAVVRFTSFKFDDHDHADEGPTNRSQPTPLGTQMFDLGKRVQSQHITIMGVFLMT